MRFVESDGQTLTNEQILERLSWQESLLFKACINHDEDGFPISLVLVSRNDSKGTSMSPGMTPRSKTG